MSISSQERILVQTVRNLAISTLEQNYPEYKKIPFILPDLFILSVEFLCEIRQDWYENGQLRAHYFYVNMQKHGEYTGWYENGKLKYQHSYVNGQEHGECKWWYENSQLDYRQPYINGELHGESKGWYKNGQLEYQITYVNGKICGECKRW